jgi:F-type H+-transporting ATPase subunit a
MNHFSVILAEEGPLGHVLDRVLIGNPGWPEFVGPILTMNTLTMLIVAAILILVMVAAANSIGGRPSSEGDDRYVTKGVLPQMIEVIVVYLRDVVIKPQLGPETKTFTPFLLTLFFFILFNNLMGLVPLLDLQHLIGSLWGDTHFAVVGGTATGRIAVTGALAIMAFILWQINGIRSAGLVAWAKHYMGGGPWYLAPIMVPVEIMGTFVKPFALALRLFANMTAGHVLLAVLLSFTAAAPKALGLIGAPITLVALGSSVAIYMLELFVAFLQAFIFMFLTTLFIAQLAHHHHDEHGHAEPYDNDGHSMLTDTAAPVSAV